MESLCGDSRIGVSGVNWSCILRLRDGLGVYISSKGMEDANPSEIAENYSANDHQNILPRRGSKEGPRRLTNRRLYLRKRPSSDGTKSDICKRHKKITQLFWAILNARYCTETINSHTW